MFAGEGDATRTNKRFHYLSEHSDAKRLSTAFDSVTLYGFDPHHRPDIYGKVGNSGVSYRDAGRYEDLVLGVRFMFTNDVRLDDYQRSGSNILAMF